MKFFRVPCILYVCAVCGCIFFASFYGGVLPYTLLWTALVLPIASAGYLFLENLTLEFSQKIEYTHVAKGDEVRLVIALENTGFLPIRGICLRSEGIACETVFPGEWDVENLTLAAKEKIKIEAIVRTEFAGSFPVGIDKVYVKDLFGFAARSYPVLEQPRLGVRPLLVEEKEILWEELSAEPARGRDRREDGSGNELRDYVRGDELHRIHWKASAKAGKWIVRLPEPEELTEICVLLVPCRSDGTKEALQRRDYFLTVAASLAEALVEKRCPAVFFYPRKGEVREMIVDDRDSFAEFYETLPDEMELVDYDVAWDEWTKTQEKELRILEEKHEEHGKDSLE